MGQKEIFLKGAAVLACANVIVKLIGALYTIPLARLIGADGMGLYSSAYQIYVWLFIISTGGIPIAISKMVSEEIALNNYRQAHKIFRISLILLIIIGFILSFLLFSYSELILKIIGTNRAYYCLLCISPCLVFVAVISVFRGYFQGMQNMIPTAVSQLFEALTKAIAGIYLAYILIQKGVEYSSAGAVFGVTLGAFLGMVVLILIYLLKKPEILKRIEKSKKNVTDGAYTILVKIMKISFPITLGSSVFAMSSVIDLVMIMRRLKEIGFSDTYAVKLYGYLTGYAYKIYSLPTTIIVALAVSIVPIIAGYLANKNYNSIRKISYASIKLTVMFSLPCAIGIAILARPILKLLFNDSNATNMLIILSFSVLFASMVQITGAILQGMGKVIVPLKNLLIGSVVKIVLNYYLVGIPALNILGAPIATGLCFFVVLILNYTGVNNYIGIRLNISEIYTKPLVSSIIMGLGVYNFYKIIYFVTEMNSVAVVISVLAGILIYLISIISIKGIRQNDFKILPFGEKIYEKLFKLKIFG